MGAKRELKQIDSIVVHCAATPNGRSFTPEQIDSWHAERGFQRDMSICPGYSPLAHIGYHYVITLGGLVHRGRPLQEVGAHARGFNHQSIGICLVGTDKFTLAQWQSLLTLIQSLEAELGRSLTLSGHNQLNAHKRCPGFDVPAWAQRKFRPLTENILEGRFHELV